MGHVSSHTVVPHAIEVLEKRVISAFHRMLSTIEKSNVRRAEREIERVLGGSEAKFTDETERAIERFLLRRP